MDRGSDWDLVLVVGGTDTRGGSKGRSGCWSVGRCEGGAAEEGHAGKSVVGESWRVAAKTSARRCRVVGCGSWKGSGLRGVGV